MHPIAFQLLTCHTVRVGREKISYANFDGMRGIAALAVVVFHCAHRAGWHQFVPNGYLAVDLFFGLSGFVIAQAYGERLSQGMSFRTFAEVRLIRLYPIYAVGLALGLFYVLWMTAAGEPGFSLIKVMAALGFGVFFLPFPVHLGKIPPILPLDGPAWSLFFELLVNAAYALLLPFLNRTVLVAIIGVSAAALIAVGLRAGNLHVGWNTHSLIGGLPRVTFSFFIGVLLFGLRPALKAGNLVSFSALVVVVALLMLGVPSWKYDLPVVILAFPLLLWIGASFQPNAPISAFFKWLGELSYPMYILHMPVLLTTRAAADRLGFTGVVYDCLFFASLLMIVTAAHFLAKGYDPTARRRLSHMFAVRNEKVRAL